VTPPAPSPSVRPTLPVLVAGGSPPALLAALALSQRGIPCRLLDGQGAALDDHGRGLLLSRSALEILARHVCGASLTNLGVPVEAQRLMQKRREVGHELFAPPGGPEGPMPAYLAVPSMHLGEVLYEAVAREPSIEVSFGGRILGVKQDEARVTVALESDAGLTNVEGSFLLAADGPGSTIRGALGVPFPGRTYDELIWVAEVRAAPKFPLERRIVLDPPGAGGVGVALPIARDRWQIAWLVDGDFDPGRERASGALDRRVAGMLDGAPHELLWSSLQRIHDRRTARMRVGRVLLIGSTALVIPPFGAWTINTALGDAENAAFRVALVARGLAPEESQLSRYDAERSFAADRAQESARKTMSFLAPGSWTGLTARNAALRGLSLAPRQRDTLGPARPYRPCRYDGGQARLADGCQGAAGSTPPNAGGDRKATVPPVAVGTLAPDGPCTLQPRRTRTRVRTLFGPGFVGLFFPGSRVSVDYFAAWANQRESAAPFRLFLVTRPQQALDAGRVPGFDAVLVDAEGTLRAAYGVPETVPMLFVVRPDGYICACVCETTGSSLTDVLEDVTGCHPEERSSSPPAAPPPSDDASYPSRS